MKSLEERLKYRAAQKAAQKKEDVSPKLQNTEVGEKTADKFDAGSWLDDGAKNINGSLKDLSDDELTALEEAEGSGKKRQSVLASLKKEKDERASRSAGWNHNKA